MPEFEITKLEKRQVLMALETRLEFLKECIDLRIEKKSTRVIRYSSRHFNQVLCVYRKLGASSKDVERVVNDLEG